MAFSDMGGTIKYEKGRLASFDNLFILLLLFLHILIYIPFVMRINLIKN